MTKKQDLQSGCTMSFRRNTITMRNLPEKPGTSETRLITTRHQFFPSLLFSTNLNSLKPHSHLSTPISPIRTHPHPIRKPSLPSKNGLRTLPTPLTPSLPNPQSPFPTLPRTQRVPRQRNATAQNPPPIIHRAYRACSRRNA